MIVIKFHYRNLFFGGQTFRKNRSHHPKSIFDRYIRHLNMGESQYSRYFRSEIPKIRISKIHQKWSKLCSGEWNGTRKWCFGSCCTFVFDAFNQHLNWVKKMQVLVRKSVSKCHRSSLFPTFSFSLINKTHGRCHESRLFHSQRFCFEFLFTPKRWKRAFCTSRQNKTYFSRKCVQSVSDNVMPVTDSAQQNVSLLQLDGRTTAWANPPTHVTGATLRQSSFFWPLLNKSTLSNNKNSVNEKRAPRPTSLFRAQSCRYCTMKLGLCVQVYPHTHFLRVQLTRFCAARYGSTTERVFQEHHVRKWNPDVKILSNKVQSEFNLFQKTFLVWKAPFSGEILFCFVVRYETRVSNVSEWKETENRNVVSETSDSPDSVPSVSFVDERKWECWK